MSQKGRERVPPNLEPNRVESNFTLAKRAFSVFLYSGMPHRAQQPMRMAQGSQA